MAYQEFLIDKRIVARHIEKGFVEAKLYEKGITQLPDRTDNIAATAVEDDDDLDEGDDDEE